MKRTAILIVVGSLFCGMAGNIDFSGRWTGNLKKADSTLYPLTYNFSLSGDSITGTAKSELGEFPIDHGKIDSTGLHFTVTVSGLDIYHDATIYNDSIGMNITMNGSTAHCTLKRSAN